MRVKIYLFQLKANSANNPETGDPIGAPFVNSSPTCVNFKLNSLIL